MLKAYLFSIQIQQLSPPTNSPQFDYFLLVNTNSVVEVIFNGHFV